MSSREKPDEAVGSAEHKGQRQQKRQTVQVAKELVVVAKKVAVFKGVTLASYASGVLSWCADRIVVEIAELGALGVRDRAEALDFSKVPKGTFNIDPAVATRINMLAGSCLTSAAKLVHPYLKAVVEGDARVEGGWKLPYRQDDPPPLALPSESDFPTHEAFVDALSSAFKREKLYGVSVRDDSLTEFDYARGDLLILSPVAIEQGDTVLVIQGEKMELRTVGAKPSGKPSRKGGRRPVAIELDEARRVKAAKVVGSMRVPAYVELPRPR